MADDRDRAIRDYAVLTPRVINPGIVKPEVHANNFELKPVMFQMLQTMGHSFKIVGASQEAIRLLLFSFSLRDRARVWLNYLPPDSITTWNY